MASKFIEIQNENEKIKDPIFIVGMARTGTTLLARILSQSQKIYFLNETHFMREFKEQITDETSFKKLKVSPTAACSVVSLGILNPAS